MHASCDAIAVDADETAPRRPVPAGRRRPASDGPDAELRRRFVAGEIGAVVEIYERYAGAVFTVAMSRLGDRQLAEDAVQNVFVNAWRAAAGFDAERELSPWLYAIARRSAAEIARRERRRPVTPLVDATIVAPEGTTFDDAWEAWEVRCALRELPDDARELIRLTYYLGLSQSQIADRLGIPLGTVKSRIHRAQRWLAVRLAHLQR
jgi:RNA polymerase sigma-70 factor (ECF subfamily)